MSIVLTMMVRDEIDIVECNLTHHLSQGVSEIIVTDNGSLDGTRDLLATLACSAPLTIIDEPPSDWSQGRWVTRMARMAHDRFKAQWVINGDADEFFMAPDSGLKAVLDDAGADCDLLWISRHDFVAIDRPNREAPPLEMVYRKRESLNPVSRRPIAPKVIHRGTTDVLIGQGCHDANAPARVTPPIATSRRLSATGCGTGTTFCNAGCWMTSITAIIITIPTDCARASPRATSSRTRG